MKKEIPLIALVPDRFAHYRYPVFKLLSGEERNGFRLVIYADSVEDNTRVRIVSSGFCNMDRDDGGILWQKIRSFYIGNICFWQTGLIRLALGREYSLIVYWGEAHRFSTWVSALAARAMRKKVVFWTHGIYGNEGFIKKVIRALFYRISHSLLLYSDYGLKELEKTGFPRERMLVIKNSLDVEQQLRIVRQIKESQLRAIKKTLFDESDKVLVFVGRLQSSKRIDILMHALRLLNNKYDVSIKALLIGDGPMRGELQVLAQQLEIEEKVVFYGECYEERIVIPLLAMSDICVSPGEVGLTAMHSLISGTPVITHNDFSNQMPEVEAIEDGLSGAFFRREDVDDLVEKINLCLNDIDSGRITAETCRSSVTASYTPEYQRSVFCQAVSSLVGQ